MWKENDMITVFLLSLSVAGCPLPKLENKTNFPWNDYDRKTFKHASKRCGELYTNSPCVKLFRKWGEQDYSVLCGGK